MKIYITIAIFFLSFCKPLPRDKDCIYENNISSKQPCAKKFNLVAPSKK